MTINVDKIREELRALYREKTGRTPCGASMGHELTDRDSILEGVAAAVGALFLHEYEDENFGREWPQNDYDNENSMAEALIAEYCGLTEEEAS